MGGLFSSLHTASNALEAFSRALGSDELNIANATTPGYAAVKAVINPINLSGHASAGSFTASSDFVSLSSTGDFFSDALARAASSAAGESQTRADQLSPLNQLFDITGSTGILAAFQQFSRAFSALSVTPNDATLRAQALSAAGGVASAFNRTAAGLDQQRQQIDSGIGSTTEQINALADRIRQLNVEASSQSQFDPGIDASLRTDLDQLSSLVDITVQKNANGGVTVLAGGSLPLVIGDHAYSISADPSAPAGSQVTSTGGGAAPASLSGKLGALLSLRAGTFDQLLGSGANPGSLNTLAAGFASRVNSLLAAGVTETGAVGVSSIFSLDNSDPTNSARSLSLETGISGDQLGLATTGAGAQSNGVANQLASLAASSQVADQIGGLSPQSYFASLAAFVGQQTSDATNASAADRTRLTSAQASRQQQIGVSLDQEAVNITTYQRAYEANARLVGILSELTDTEVNLIK